jgi:sensor c-di-GMP phosphodiesterase-like protein
MLVQTILVIARNLGLECVAEGIESEAQLDCLREHGCSLGQGYHFSRPLREAEFLAWMADQVEVGAGKSALVRPF